MELAVVARQNMNVLPFAFVQELDGKVAVEHFTHILRIALDDLLHLLAACIKHEIVSKVTNAVKKLS